MIRGRYRKREPARGRDRGGGRQLRGVDETGFTRRVDTI